MVYIHGGGYSQGTRKDGWRQAQAMARGGYVGVTIDYRLMQQAPFPASLHDCKSAIRYLRAHAESLRIDPERIAVWGHSAGGHLSALLGTTGNAPEMEGEVGITDESSVVSCVVDLSGPTDIYRLMTGRSSSEPAAGENEQQRSMRAKTKAANPTTYADGNDPPFLIVHGVDDTAIPIVHSELLDAALRKAGAPVEFLRVPDCGHNIEPGPAWERIGAFLDEHLGGNAAEILQSGLPH